MISHSTAGTPVRAVPTSSSAASTSPVPPIDTTAEPPGSATTAIPRPGPASVAAPTRGTLLTADRIVTLGRGRTRARALVVRGSRVVWVGDDEADAPPYRDRIDLDGCVIGPAFVDAHAHLTMSGLSLTGLDLS